MYESEYSNLLALLARAIGVDNGARVESDPKTLCALAKRHSVMNLLYAAVKGDDRFPAPLLAALERELFATAHQQLLQEEAAAALFARLRAEGIPFLPMKGIVMRPLYPAPELRVSCDVDVLYDKRHRRRLDALMRELGYVCEASDPNHDEYHKPPCIAIEMHRNLLTDFKTVDRYYADIWTRLTPVGEGEYRMSDEDFYIYQTVHTMKHFIGGGTGIRSVLDTFIYLQKKPSLDRVYLERELEKLGLLSFHCQIERLARVWFGGEEMPDELLPISEYILGSGTYGLATQKAANQTARTRGGKIGYLFSRAFPSYRFMAEKHPSLRRVPILLPFFWVARLFRALFGKRGDAGRELSALSKTDRDQMEKLGAVMRAASLENYR